MDKPRRKSAKSQRSSSRSVLGNLGQSENNPNVRMSRDMAVIPPSEIPLIKWREIIDDAEEDFVVNSIREEIIRNAMDALYDRYLEKTSYAFVVHCSHRAWLQLFNFINLKHDPGENVQTIAARWSYDDPPDPVPVDPWACRRMTVHKEESLLSPETKPCTAPCSMNISIGPLTSVPSFTVSSPDAESSKWPTVSSLGIKDIRIKFSLVILNLVFSRLKWPGFSLPP